jgi:hypothetical protein
VLVTLLAEVALNYTEARTWQARIAAAEANLKTQEETFQLTSWRQQAGSATTWRSGRPATTSKTPAPSSRPSAPAWRRHRTASPCSWENSRARYTES